MLEELKFDLKVFHPHSAIESIIDDYNKFCVNKSLSIPNILRDNLMESDQIYTINPSIKLAIESIDSVDQGYIYIYIYIYIFIYQIYKTKLLYFYFSNTYLGTLLPMLKNLKFKSIQVSKFLFL